MKDVAQPESGPSSEVQIVRSVANTLADTLPQGWSIKPVVGGPIDRGLDAHYTLAAPDGRRVTLIVEAKRMLDGRDVTGLAEQLQTYTETMADAQGLVAARYLSPPVRARLAEQGIAFADATGNVRLQVSSPGLFISHQGADADPWRGPGRPRGTLKGAPAARIVRAIADFSGDWSVRELVDVAQVSTGACYRVIDFLEREGLAERPARGQVSIPRWDEILRRWSADYGFVRNSRLTRWIAPRGLDDLLKRIGTTETTDYAVTGTIAAAEWAAYAPARAAMIYTRDVSQAVDAWGLRPADAGANVMLAEPEIDVPFIRTEINQAGIRLAAPTQVAVDLMTGPGRSPQEAEELLQWMVRSERSWRR